MAKEEFTSGSWVEYRDQVNLADRFAIAEAMKVEMNGPSALMAVQNDARNALLGRIILGWSYDAAIPSQNSFVAADVLIASVMSLEDYDELSLAIEPMLTRLLSPPAKVADPKKQPSK